MEYYKTTNVISESDSKWEKLQPNQDRYEQQIKLIIQILYAKTLNLLDDGDIDDLLNTITNYNFSNLNKLLYKIQKKNNDNLETNDTNSTNSTNKDRIITNLFLELITYISMLN